MGMTRTPLDIICLRARRFESCRCRDSFALLFVFFGWLVVEICRTEGGGWGSRAPSPQSPTNATPALFYRAKHRVRLVHSEVFNMHRKFINFARSVWLHQYFWSAPIRLPNTAMLTNATAPSNEFVRRH
jgi:hypothetical protein